MAVRDHSLDGAIIDAARAEFLEHGFQKASLHKIADRAGITTGALYTRYRNKDDLFCSLVTPVFSEIGSQLGQVEDLYRRVRQTRDPEDLLLAIRREEKIYLDLLFDHYDECVLFFCKSDGSSLEARTQGMMAEKSRQTAEFFRTLGRRPVDTQGIELIMSQQFFYYRQILLRGYSRETALSCMKTADLFMEAGWKALLESIL